jgi:hypothetical protein
MMILSQYHIFELDTINIYSAEFHCIAHAQSTSDSTAHEQFFHKGHRAFSLVVRIGSPAPSPFGSKGGDTYLLAGEGTGGANSDEGTDILVLWV